MTRPHNGPTNVPVRRTMIKPTVGAVRKAAYDLPNTKNPDHIYGYQVKRDDEDAGQVLRKWVQAVPSKAAQSKRSFVATNRMAVAAGCVSPKANRQFANEHANIHVQKIDTPLKSSNVSPDDTTYGIRTAESEDISGLIQAKHTHFSYADIDYPDLSTMHIKGKLPLPRDTKASVGKDCRLRQNVEKKPFKMKKFEKVKAVVSSQPSSNKLVQPAPEDVHGGGYDEQQQEDQEEEYEHYDDEEC